MDNIGKTIGQRLGFLRNKLDFTQAELAEQAQIPLRTLQAIEYDKVKSPGVAVISKLASAMNVHLSDLLPSEKSPDALLDAITDMTAILARLVAMPPTLRESVFAIVLGEDRPSLPPDVARLVRELIAKASRQDR